MDIIFIILIFGSLVGVGKTIEEMRRKKNEKESLKNKLGEEYDEFIEMRKKKRRF